MPLYPGTAQPEFTDNSRFATDGYREMKIRMTSHIGTHIDAPAHIIEDGKTLDQLPVDTFYGRAFVLDVSRLSGSQIDLSHVQDSADKITGMDFLLLYSGYDNLWGDAAYFKDFPVLSTAAARWLTGHIKNGVGLDMCSVDPVGSADLPVHNVLLGKGLVIVENLINLKKLVDTQITFSCLPLKFRQADGSPVRAVGMI
jgi:kynurenine formamidase